MNKLVQEIIDEGGEGAILRRVGSYYERGRSPDLIKLKVTTGDMEGIVEQVLGDNSVVLKLPNGIKITLPPSNVRIPTPSVGSIVSFSYESHTKREEPVNPIIYRVRGDLEWDDVVQHKTLTDDSQVKQATPALPIGHWDAKNMREFLENIAKASNLDPLAAATWYNIPKSIICQTKGGRTILSKLKGHFNALRTLFPDVELNNIAFQRSKWEEVENRRKFFENYANAKGFDSQKPENWYMQSRKSIMSFKGAASIIKVSVANTLMDLFPNIGLQRAKFPYVAFRKSRYRNFFENFAKLHHFDPEIPDNWYSQTKAKVFAMKGGRMILAKYRNSLSRALLSVFPNIGLVKSLFTSGGGAKWDERSRSFFESYAKRNGFDSTKPENWYSQSITKLMSSAEARSIVRHFNSSVPQALAFLFPNIGLENWKFWTSDFHNRRRLFERFAEQNGFNTLNADHWHSQAIGHIMAFEGVSDVVHHHHNSIAKALCDLFPDIGLDFQKLAVHESRFIFTEFARENTFDPLVSVKRKSNLQAHQEVSNVLQRYQGNLKQALEDIFPNVRVAEANMNSAASGSDRPQQRFLEEIVLADGFDPLVPGNRSHHKNVVCSFKHEQAAALERSTTQNVIKPSTEVSTNRSHKSLLCELENRRKFFESYAISNGFDPHNADNWHTHRMRKIMAHKGAFAVIAYHNQSISQALQDSFPNIGLVQAKLIP